ncbi:MAG: 2-oxo acid dehydrogenase subunit E2 [Chitinophagales bacterium]|jgi:2-oxoglutarate dehydrogenase E2 component (dihydrolipoamide succinyltransferase)|nr:2-oxo acid dehydrogenase subunit E2 [Chitinophagales bacterium]
MARYELIMPKMGESITEATILRWNKKVGDSIKADDAVLEIATDKVDSEVPSPVSGVLKEILFQENDVVAVGKAVAIIETESAGGSTVTSASSTPAATVTAPVKTAAVQQPVAAVVNNGNRFYSPLVLNIAKQEGVSMSELEAMPGTGAEGRVTKKDILNYVENKKNGVVVEMPAVGSQQETIAVKVEETQVVAAKSYSGNVEIVEMDRMRKLIATNMVNSKHVSAHVTSFVEADVTNLVLWRNKIKDKFKKMYGENFTFTPIFIEAVAKALRDFPMINSSIDGNNIVIKKDLNVGMAAALPSGNLIVPVIKNADMLNLVGLAKKVNELADRARTNKLKPEEIEGGTFTLSNVGTFGNVMGTPIILQPQVAILAVGAIRKKPVVIETPEGDTIGIRHMMFLSHSYDHRIVDGALGGSFVKRVADYLEKFDINREL